MRTLIPVVIVLIGVALGLTYWPKMGTPIQTEIPKAGSLEAAKAVLKEQPTPDLKDVASDLREEGAQEIAQMMESYSAKLQEFDTLAAEVGVLESEYTKIIAADPESVKRPETAALYRKLDDKLADMRREHENIARVSTALSEKYGRYVRAKYESN